MQKTIVVVSTVMLIVLACFVVFGSGNTTDAEYNEHSGEYISVSGIVRGYTTHYGLHHVNIDAVSYKIKGMSSGDIESMIGSEITIKLLDHGDYYEYIGIGRPIKEEVISMSISEDDLENLDFCDWLEEKHPIINKLLWGRYNRLNG